MLIEIESMARPYPVSIVTDREASQSLKEIIKKEGMLLQ